MPPPRRLIWGEHGRGKTTALAQAAAGLLASGVKPTQILALSVHGHGTRWLRSALEDALGAEVPTADVRRRATAILEQFPGAANLPPGWRSTAILSAVDRHVLMRGAWSHAADEPGSLYARYGSAPGALDWLQPLFDAFAEWAGTADPERLKRYVPADPALAELWSAYRGYLHLSQQHGVVAFQEVLGRALDALKDADVQARIVPRVLLLDDVDLFRPSELLFARGLVSAETRLVATSSPLPDDRSPDPGMRYLARWCAELDLAPEERVDAAAPAPVREQVRIKLPTIEAEVEAIARYITTTMAAGGRFADYAVIAFDPALPPLLRRALPRGGIPVDGMEARDAFSLALAPLLHAAMRLHARLPLPAQEFAAFLSHPLLGLSSYDAHLLASAIAGTTGGARLPGGYDFASFPERRWPDELSPEGRRRLHRIMESIEDLRLPELAPSTKLRRWLAALNLLARSRDLAATVLDAWAVAADQELVERWLAFVERTEQLHASLGSPLGDVEAVEVLAHSQSLVEPISRPLSDAVQVWQPDQLGGCTASTVWIAGLHEDALPPKSVPFSWVTPEALTTALSVLPGWIQPEQDDPAARWSQALAALHRAAGRARQTVILSWSSAGRDGRRRLPSPVLESLPGGARTVPHDLHHPWSGERSSPHRHPLPAPSLHVGATGVEFAPPPPGAVFTTSPSAIENYLQCPRQYFYARVLQLYDISSSPRQALGQVVHAALRDLKSKEDVFDTAALIDEHWPANDRRWGTRLREAAFRRLAEQAVKEVETFDRTCLPADVRFVLAEASFTWQIAPDVELRGTIDRIDSGPDGLTILDYKLGAHSPTLRELLDKFAPPPEGADLTTWRPADLQLPLYALAVERGSVEGLPPEAGSRVAAVGLMYPRELFTPRGKPSEKGRRMVRIVDHTPNCAACGVDRAPARAVLCRDELGRIADRALVAIAGMRGGQIDPDPREGFRTCGACPFRTICPAPRA